jgi:demethylmenaquinone methyltransferase/2-methoxy-6-polyprenyl-1,4-benzoquinol methylase
MTPDKGGAAPTGGSGAMFDGIAGRYDLLNRLMSLGLDQGWRKKTVKALALGEGPARVLDLATGTADLALCVARAHPQAQVTGVDPSARMLEIGAGKVAASGLGERVRLALGDAQRLDFPTDSFDAACMAFGIRNVPDRPAALREMARVVRKDGRIAILELSEPEEGPLAPLARLHVRRIVPFVGGLLSGQREYRYLQESIARFPHRDAFAALMTEAGLRVIEVRPLSFGACCLYVAHA